MENSYDEECFKKWEIDECEAEMEKVVQWIGKRKLHGRVRVAFIEESYERQGYRMGIPKQVYVSRVLANIRKKSGEKEITNPKVGVLGKEVMQTNRIFDRRVNSGYGKG